MPEHIEHLLLMNMFSSLDAAMAPAEPLDLVTCARCDQEIPDAESYECDYCHDLFCACCIVNSVCSDWICRECWDQGLAVARLTARQRAADEEDFWEAARDAANSTE